MAAPMLAPMTIAATGPSRSAGCRSSGSAASACRTLTISGRKLIQSHPVSACIAVIAAELIRRGLDRLHVGIRQAEMVADLMDQHMGDDGPERLLVLGPIIEDRSTIEPDHVGHLA